MCKLRIGLYRPKVDFRPTLDGHMYANDNRKSSTMDRFGQSWPPTAQDTGPYPGRGGGGRGGRTTPPPYISHWRRNRGGGKGALFRVGRGKDMFVPPPQFQTQNLGPEHRHRAIEIHRATDICDVTLARLTSRCWARQMSPPPPPHFVTFLRRCLYRVPPGTCTSFSQVQT